MNDLNQILFEGRLVRDPKARKLESGALVCSFSLASNTHYVDKKTGNKVENTTFMLVETWGNVAEVCVAHLNKGDGVRVVGKIKQSRWEKDGRIQMEKTFIAAEHVEFKPKSVKPTSDVEIPVEGPEQVKATDELDIQEQEAINEEIIKESQD